MRHMTPDWVLQLTWFLAAMGATGALWYFLAQKNFHGVLWSCYFTAVLVLLAISLHVRNDLVRKEEARASTARAGASTMAEPLKPALPPPSAASSEPTPSTPLTREAPQAPPSLSHVGLTGALGAPVTINAPHGVISLGQQGGITAREVVINTSPPPQVMASAQRQQAPSQPGAPWLTEFSISATATIQTGDLRLRCSGPAMRAGIERINPYQLITGGNGPDPRDSTLVVYELGPETLSAGRSIAVQVFSAAPVSVLSGHIGEHPIQFPASGLQTPPEGPSASR